MTADFGAFVRGCRETPISGVRRLGALTREFLMFLRERVFRCSEVVTQFSRYANPGFARGFEYKEVPL